VFQNIGIQNSEAGELPRRKHTNITSFENVKLLGYFKAKA
jgi:hypothetical protein